MSDRAPPDENYSLLQSKIIERLVDVEFFIPCIANNYKILAVRWGCQIQLSRRRLREAHSFWQEDVRRTLRESMPDGTTHLDHFKNASFIAFWLRRMLPINETQRRPFDPRKGGPGHDFGQFFQYGNEISALLIGFQICLFYEASRMTEQSSGAVPINPDREKYLRGLKFPPSLLNDFAMVLKHKNISPHSLYLMYKSLFTALS